MDIMENIRQKILKAYTPEPEIIDLWYESDLGVFRAVLKQIVKGNIFLYISEWAEDTEKCLNEIELNERTYQAIYKTTQLHALFKEE